MGLVKTYGATNMGGMIIQNSCVEVHQGSHVIESIKSRSIIKTYSNWLVLFHPGMMIQIHYFLMVETTYREACGRIELKCHKAPIDE
jgi:hypothetical protein